ncbi:AlwI family type II restriction endonuclease [Fictibacillus sp. KU28468]|uniref:AlwI family type II restriction endonuclease n=1 Tax=Fictibacillus sp. KU28468 TaxID=2991053 RepID=UPI00223E6435|nr:AlwI family type II restriction endonuclease [Fictibacillus sp. KU28468]UZJ78608.1 AlwI family type II restriction endonuclease [Fictibacillus sp. KU28468]
MPERKVWFITRPERDPRFHVDALKALQIATENFTVTWSKNRIAHKRYEEVLAAKELKRNNISTDGSGGRTWAAMLRTFGYVYTTPTGQLSLTKVGASLLADTKKRENIKKQILTLQIPNAYFLESGFRPKFEEGFQIRPARFLILLVNQAELNYYITKEEITFFALTAQKDTELNEVTQKILAYRAKTTETEKIEMKKEIASLYDHRERSDKGARDFSAAHGDVAHTFMMLCEYTELAEYVRGQFLRVPSEKHQFTTNELNEFDRRYPFNKRYLISLERFSENAGLDVDSYKASAFGAIGPATNQKKLTKKIHRLLASFPSLQELSLAEIETVLKQELSTAESKKFASALKEYRYSSLNDDFVESYLYEENNLVFEEKTAKILEAVGFEVELRPKPENRDLRTQIEILLHLDEETICIIDAKNYKKKFSLPAHLTSHMGSEYIPNYNGYKGKLVKYYGYITASDWGGEKNLEKITEKANSVIPDLNPQGAIISANALLGFLDYCLDNELTKAQRRQSFISCFTNKGYRNVSEMF